MPHTNCCVRGCSNSNDSTGISTHLLPKNADIRAKWIANLNLPKEFATGKHIVCSAHFRECDFTEMLQFASRPNSRRRLKTGAIPEITVKRSPDNATAVADTFPNELPKGKKLVNASTQVHCDTQDKKVQCHIIGKSVSTQTLHSRWRTPPIREQRRTTPERERTGETRSTAPRSCVLFHHRARPHSRWRTLPLRKQRRTTPERERTRET